MGRLHTMEYENVLQFAVIWYMSIHPYTPSSDTSDSRGSEAIPNVLSKWIRRIRYEI